MDGLESLERICKFNCSATELGPCIIPCEEHQTIEKELKILQILKKKRINIFGLGLEMKLHPDWTLDQYVEYNNYGLPTPYHVTKEEMKLIIEWIREE